MDHFHDFLQTFFIHFQITFYDGYIYNLRGCVKEIKHILQSRPLFFSLLFIFVSTITIHPARTSDVNWKLTQFILSTLILK